jgi:hypothetical protein
MSIRAILTEAFVDSDQNIIKSEKYVQTMMMVKGRW